MYIVCLSVCLVGWLVGWLVVFSAPYRRTGPGHCYRLYSSTVYANDFEAFAQPEVKTMPLEDVVLQMKAMNIRRPVASFPFPSPPDKMALRRAVGLLLNLGALVKKSKATSSTAVANWTSATTLKLRKELLKRQKATIYLFINETLTTLGISNIGRSYLRFSEILQKISFTT